MADLSRLNGPLREFVTPMRWEKPLPLRSEGIQPELVQSFHFSQQDLKALRSQQARELLDQARGYISNNPTARSLAGLGIGATTGLAGTAAINTVLPDDMDIDPYLLPNLGGAIGMIPGNVRSARVLF